MEGVSIYTQDLITYRKSSLWTLLEETIRDQVIALMDEYEKLYNNRVVDCDTKESQDLISKYLGDSIFKYNPELIFINHKGVVIECVEESIVIREDGIDFMLDIYEGLPKQDRV